MAIGNSDGSIVLTTKIEDAGLKSGMQKIIADQKKQLNSLVAEYANLIRQNKKGSEEAGKLKVKIDDLSKSLKENEGVLGKLGGSSSGAVAAFGKIGIIVAAVMAVITPLISALSKLTTAFIDFSKASSEIAMQTESSVYRLTSIYGKASDVVGDFIDANAMALGMSKSAAASFASVYGNLFDVWADQTTNAQLTNKYLKMTAAVASQTGRTVEDVQERIRSGLLGNTEAIEDLGIFVNVKTIEMTDAFKRMANGKSWEQLDAYTQQQIRSMAILEQATEKYGDQVAETSVLAKSRLSAAWQDFQSTWGTAVNTVLVPMLNVVTQIIQVATIGLQALVGSSGEILENADQTLGKQEGITEETKETEKAQKGVLAGFDKINILSAGDETKASGSEQAEGTVPVDFELKGTDKVVVDLETFKSTFKDKLTPIEQNALELMLSGGSGVFVNLEEFKTQFGDKLSPIALNQLELMLSGGNTLVDLETFKTQFGDKLSPIEQNQLELMLSGGNGVLLNLDDFKNQFKDKLSPVEFNALELILSEDNSVLVSLDDFKNKFKEKLSPVEFNALELMLSGGSGVFVDLEKFIDQFGGELDPITLNKLKLELSGGSGTLMDFTDFKDKFGDELSPVTLNKLELELSGNSQVIFDFETFKSRFKDKLSPIEQNVLELMLSGNTGQDGVLVDLATFIKLFGGDLDPVTLNELKLQLFGQGGVLLDLETFKGLLEGKLNPITLNKLELMLSGTEESTNKLKDFKKECERLLSPLRESFGKLFEKLTEAFNEVKQDVFAPLSEWFTTELTPQLISDITDEVDDLTEAVRKLSEESDGFGKTSLLTFLEDLIKTASELGIPVLRILSGAMEDLGRNSDELGIALDLLWSTISPFFTTSWTTLLSVIRNFISIITEATASVGSLTGAVSEFFAIKFDEENSEKHFQRMLAHLANFAISQVNILIATLNLAISGAYGLVANFVNTIFGALGTLLRITGVKEDFDVSWDAVPQIPYIPKLPIPELAKGAVIPPNHEFLAVLGDQKQGLNIETPLATMVEAFQMALDSRGGYNGGGNTEVILEIDGREFGRAVVEQGNRENRRIGTRLVIG